MKKHKLIIILLCMFFSCSIFMNDTLAKGSSKIVHVMQEEEENTDGNDFITDAIRSPDENTAKEEASQNYIKNFYHSSETAMTDSLNIFKPETIIMTLLNFFTKILELLGIGFMFVVMVLYNFVSTSFLSTMVNSVISSIEKVMFDWSDMNSWIIKVLVISAIMGIAYQLIKNFTKIHGYKQILQICLSGIISVSFVIFIGQHGRPIMGALETTVQDMIIQTFVFDGQSTNMEIANKENIFNTLQLQPFMLRHFGTASTEAIALRSKQTLKEAETRVQDLLDHPDEDHAEKEYDDFDNGAISHDIGSCSAVLFMSFLGLIHRIIMSVIIIVLCVATGTVKLLKEIMLWLSIYQLIWWMIKRTHKAQQWFTDRLSWCVFAMGADILFGAAMYFIMQMCTQLSSINPLFAIGFDIIMLFAIILAGKNIGNITAKLKDDGGEVLQAMVMGGSSPGDTFQRLHDKHKKNHINNGDELESYDHDDSTSEDLFDPMNELSDISDVTEENLSEADHSFADDDDQMSQSDDASSEMDQITESQEIGQNTDQHTSEKESKENLLDTDTSDELENIQDAHSEDANVMNDHPSMNDKGPNTDACAETSETNEEKDTGEIIERESETLEIGESEDIHESVDVDDNELSDESSEENLSDVPELDDDPLPEDETHDQEAIITDDYLVESPDKDVETLVEIDEDIQDEADDSLGVTQETMKHSHDELDDSSQYDDTDSAKDDVELDDDSEIDGNQNDDETETEHAENEPIDTLNPQNEAKELEINEDEILT